MNMNDKEISKVVKALECGKDIQVRNIAQDIWITIDYELSLSYLVRRISEGEEFRVFPEGFIFENLKFAGKPVLIEIPEKDNRIANWNEPHNIYNTCYIKTVCGYFEMSLIKKIVDLHEIPFGKKEKLLNQGRDLTIGEKVFTLKEAKRIVSVFEKHIKPLMGVYSKRGESLRIE